MASFSSIIKSIVSSQNVQTAALDVVLIGATEMGFVVTEDEKKTVADAATGLGANITALVAVGKTIWASKTEKTA